MNLLKIVFFLIICFKKYNDVSSSQTRVPLIPTHSQQFFELLNKVSMHNYQHSVNSEITKYTFKSLLKIQSVWNSATKQLLEVSFIESSVNAPKTNEKLSDSVLKEITNIPDRPFYISIIDGKPNKVIAHTSRDQSLLNLERSIASLLQLQFTNTPTQELDVSGQCNAFYSVKSSTKIEKTKTDCSHWDLRVHYRPEKAFGVVQSSQQKLNYDLTADGTLLSVDSKEIHHITLAAKTDVGSQVVSELAMKHIKTGEEFIDQMNYASMEEAIKSLLEWYRVFDIEADVDGSISELKHTTLKEEIAKHKQELSLENVGTYTQSFTFAQLVPLSRITKQQQFVDILNEHTEIHTQLVDLLAAAQTIDAYNALHEVFHYDKKKDAELVEKYLQSLSIGTHPDRSIIEDLFERVQSLQSLKQNNKLYQTALLTLTALTRHSGFDSNDPLLKKISTFLVDALDTNCGNDMSCKSLYIRALQNLKDKEIIPTLMQYAKNGAHRLSVNAMLALKEFPIENFNEGHRKIFTQIFYQRARKYDTSARIIALDILMSMKPTKEQLGHLLDYLASNDKLFEIKTYIIQKLRMLAEKCTRFESLLKSCLAERQRINNYDIIAQKGLTTVLTRTISQSPTYNESLLSVQEIHQGILKRGTVELILRAGREEISTFKLGLYTAGLSSFVSDSDNDTVDDDDEEEDASATAGMEITVQGVLLRPLAFFNGQSELMGHVWSGTASDLTPAYQATILTYDYEHYIILSSGSTVYLNIIGAQSFDLSGKVEFSIWNRNANTEIHQRSGSVIVGSMVAGFTYAKVQNQFTVTNQPNLSLQADIDFYSGIKLCMQLQRSEATLIHSNTRTVELSSKSRSYKKRVTTSGIHKTAGTTLALNQKNNEMCNILFDD